MSADVERPVLEGEPETNAELVDAAVADGRVPEERRDVWMKALVDAPLGARWLLARLTPGRHP